MGRLEVALRRACGDAGGSIVVEGPAGIGKSRLLDATIEIAEGMGFLVREARGGQMEREMPFGIARQLFEPMLERASREELAAWLSGTARQALSALGRAGPGAPHTAIDPFAPINGLYWLVANIVESRPLFLVVDDAHWSDIDSLRFLVFLARRCSDLPLCVLAAARKGEPGEPGELQALRVEATMLHPKPLTPPSVHDLIAVWSGAKPDKAFSAACVQATGGNPFLVVEVLRELAAEGRSLDGSAAGLISTLVPESVERSVLFRIAGFGDEAIAICRAIAVLGRSPRLRDAAALAGIDEERARVLCDRLREAEILMVGSALDFVHPLIRDAVYREQPAGECSASHRRAAQILASTGAPARGIAPHLLLCDPDGDPWVVEVLRDAAATAFDEGAYDSAATFMDRALGEPPGDPIPILIWLGRALIQSDPFRAPDVLQQAAEGATRRELRLDALRFLALAYIWTGNLSGATNACDQALQLVGDDRRDLRWGLEAQRYMTSTAARGRDPRSTERLEVIVRGATGDGTGARAARQALAMEHFLACRPVEEMVELAVPFPAPPWDIDGIPVTVPVSAGKVLAWSGRWDDAREGFSAWTEFARRSGRLVTVALGNTCLSEVDRLSGRLADAEAHARTGWTIIESMMRFSVVGWTAVMNLAATLLLRGDIPGFLKATDGFDLSAGPPDIPLNPWPLELRGYLRIAQGDNEGGADDLMTLGASLERLGYLNPAYPPWRQEAAEALAALGRMAEADELITVAEERARAFGAPQVIASVARVRALIEPRKRSIASLERVVATFEMHGPPHELARSLIDFGSALHRDGRRKEARDPLRRALEVAHGCGAGGLEERARKELTAAGARPRRIARTGLAALTATELRTAELAASGLTNNEIAERLFVTARTVETHLTHVYEKLSIAGRRHLTEALAAEGP